MKLKPEPVIVALRKLGVPYEGGMRVVSVKSEQLGG